MIEMSFILADRFNNSFEGRQIDTKKRLKRLEVSKKKPNFAVANIKD